MDLPALAAYNEAVAAPIRARTATPSWLPIWSRHWSRSPTSPTTLRAQAGDALKLRESTWAPLAAQLGGWVPMEEEARSLDGTVKTMTAAKKWMADHAGAFRNLRLEPIAAQARKIWGAAAPGEQRRPRRHHAGRHGDAAPGDPRRLGRRRSPPKRCR